MVKSINFSLLNNDKNKQILLQKIHKSLISGENIECRIFPIYIRYTRGDDIIALLFYKGKQGNLSEVELGLSLKNSKIPDGFSNGKNLKYPGINFSIKLNKTKDLSKKIIDIISTTKQ